MKVTVATELPINAETYMLERDGAAFRSFIAEEMSLLEYEIVKCWQEGGATKVAIASKPDIGSWIPGALASKVPESLTYTDEVTYQPEKLLQPPYVLDVRSDAPALGDKASGGGPGSFSSRILVEPLGPDRCRHTLEQVIEFKGLWGLGSMAKKLAKRSIEQTFDELPGIISKWTELRQELLQTPHGRERLLAGRPCVEGVPWMEEAAAAIQKHGAHHRRSRQPKQPRRLPSPSAAATQAPGLAASIPALWSPFADAADSGPAQAQEQDAATGQRKVQHGTQQQLRALPESAVPAGGDDASAYEDAMEGSRLRGRQSTAGTVWFTPPASPATSAAAELPNQRSSGLAQLSHVSEAGSDTGTEGAGAAGADVEGSGGRPRGSSGYSASSEEEALEDDVEAKWGRCESWRAYYLQHGLSPTHASRVLPEELVRKFLNGRHQSPVQAARVPAAGEGGAAHGSPSKRSSVRRLFASCTGRHTTASE